jgi:diguanylate cyclase (GGDEF)-like protein
VKKTRQIKKLERVCDSIKSERALAKSGRLRKSGRAKSGRTKGPATLASVKSIGKLARHKPARQIRRLGAPNVTIGASDSAVAKLKARVRRLTGELSEARGRIEELESWAETDFLLDIPNRRGFERELHRAIAYIKRYHVAGALIVLDVDRLKPVNDAFGHAAGDAVLKGIVNVILRHVRSSDVIGRLGGDEFAVLLWNLDEAATRAKATALENAIDHLTFVFRGRSISSGASAGMTIITPTDSAAAALERADLAMYERKKNRREQMPPRTDFRR